MESSSVGDENQNNNHLNGESSMGDLDDLEAVASLQRQEAFDENLEEVHDKISRRGRLAKSFSASMGTLNYSSEAARKRESSSLSPPKDDNDARDYSNERLIKILATPAQGSRKGTRRYAGSRRNKVEVVESVERALTPPRDNKSFDESRTSDSLKPPLDAVRQHRSSASDHRSSHASDFSLARKSPHTSSLHRKRSSSNPRPDKSRGDGGSVTSGGSDRHRRRRPGHQPRIRTASSSPTGSSRGVGSVTVQYKNTDLTDLNRKLNELGLGGVPVSKDAASVSSSISSPRREKRPEFRKYSSMVQHSKYKSSSSMSVHSPRSSAARKRISAPPEKRGGRRHRSRSNSTERKEGINSKSTSRPSPPSPPGPPSRSSSEPASSLPSPARPLPSGRVSSEPASSSFDQLWKDDLGQDSDEVKELLNGSTKSNESDLISLTDTRSSMGGKPKKTKLEKIHELQGKCDRYKQEWQDAVNEKRKYRKELDAKRREVVTLSRKLEIHVGETTILQKNLSEALQQLDDIQAEQGNERAGFSQTSKELAQARIDHARAVNEKRELQSKLDRMEEELKERDRQISNFKEELKASKENVDILEADLAYADDQISKLEEDIKKIEEEVVMYREAAEKDDGDGSHENLRVVRDEMEKRLFEEREKRLDEKQRKLDEKMKQFEEERQRHLEQYQKREQEYQMQQAQEGEKLKARDEDRQKRDDEINQRLKELEDDNAALQGRLKSEQLDAAMKLKNKDSAIELLQKELAQLKKEQRERDADPDGLSSLQEQVEGLKEELETAQSELEEIQQQNKMLQEEVGDTKLVNQEMKTWVQTLQDATTEQKAEIELQKRKVEEWQKKSGEWSDKAHLWKEKAEMWEKTAKFLDSDGKSEDDTTQADPQALFLAAALEKKRASEPNESRPGWRTMGSIFKKASKADEESHSARIEELEVENTKQSVEIKTLKSEIVQLQSAFKDQIYSKDQEMEELQREYEALESKNENLRKELELARKLNQSIEGESWT